MKSLNSRNKRIKYFREVTGFPFSACRRILKENNWNLDNSGIGFCVDNMPGEYGLYRFADDVITERGPWNYKIIHSLMNKTAAENISCHNQEDYCKWFKGTILFSFPEIPCSFQLDVLDYRIIYSSFDFVFIVDYLYRNVINSGLAHVVHSGEIFDLTIGKNRQEITYIIDNDEELFYWMNGDWETNLPVLFSAIDNML